MAVNICRNVNLETSMKKIFLFQDPGIEAMPEYNSGGLVHLFGENNIDFSLIDRRGLTDGIARESCDIFVLPYINGEFSVDELDAMIRFHSSGG